jgi:hypothetical protein
MLLPVISALLTSLVTLFQSSASLRLENLALRHQLAVYKQTVRAHTFIRQIASFGSGCHGCGRAGTRPSHSSSPARASPGSAHGFGTTGDA